ncbi:8-amino-3,8-dideoxy-manno-octulosonate cytidylyltransferase [Rhodanobacter lindaniclasticus]
MVVRVAQRALQAGASRVVVAVDDTRIAEALSGEAQVEICMTRRDHASGSDRLAECAEQLGWDDDDIVVNLQGDEPFAQPPASAPWPRRWPATRRRWPRWRHRSSTPRNCSIRTW